MTDDHAGGVAPQESGSTGDDVPAAEIVPSEIVTPADDPLAALGGAAGGLDLGAMMQMAQDMTARMGEAQAELATAEVEGTSGGGLVKVVLNGHLHLTSLSIDPAAFDPDDPSVLEDLVLAAWRDAHDSVAQLQAGADPLGGLGGLGGLGDLGGLGGLLGGG